MTREELQDRIDFERDPDEWIRKAQDSLESRQEIVNAVLDGQMGTENLTNGDLVIIALQLMDSVLDQHKKLGTYAVMDESYSNLYH